MSLGGVGRPSLNGAVQGISGTSKWFWVCRCFVIVAGASIRESWGIVGVIGGAARYECVESIGRDIWQRSEVRGNRRGGREEEMRPWKPKCHESPIDGGQCC